VNDGKELEVASHQIMQCILCCDNAVNIFNARNKEIKRLITYYKTQCIIVLTKHVDAYRFIIVKKIEEELTMKQ
jgi:hypothetical protein